MRLLFLIGSSLIVLTNAQYDGEANRIDAAENFAKSPASKISGDANELKAQESVEESEDIDGPPTYARPDTAPGVPEEDSEFEEIKEDAKKVEVVDKTVSKPATAEIIPETPKKSLAGGYPIPPVADSLEDSPLDELNRGDNSDVKSIVVASPSAPTSTELKNTPIRPYSSEVSVEGSGSSESSESSSSSSSSESVEEGSGAEAKTHEHEPSPPEYVRPSNAPGVPKVEKSKSAEETTVTQVPVASTLDTKAPQTLVSSNPKAVEKGMEVKPVMLPPNPPNTEMMKILKGILGSMGEVEDITMPEKQKIKNIMDSKTGQTNQKQAPTLSKEQNSEKPINKQGKPQAVAPDGKSDKANVSTMEKNKSQPKEVDRIKIISLTPKVPTSSAKPVSVTPQPVRTTQSTNGYKPPKAGLVTRKPTVAPVTPKTIPVIKMPMSIEDITMPEESKPKIVVESKPVVTTTNSPIKTEISSVVPKIESTGRKKQLEVPKNEQTGPKSEPMMQKTGPSKEGDDDFSPAQILRMANAMAALEAMAMFNKPSLTSTGDILGANGMPLTGTGMGVPVPQKLNIPTQKSGYSSNPELQQPSPSTPQTPASRTSVVATDYAPGETAQLPANPVNPKENQMEPDDLSGELVSVGEGEDTPEQSEDDRLHFIKPDRVDEDIPPVPRDPSKAKEKVETLASKPQIAEIEPKLPVSQAIKSESTKSGKSASLIQKNTPNTVTSTSLETYLKEPNLSVIQNSNVSQPKMSPAKMIALPWFMDPINQVAKADTTRTTKAPVAVKKFEGMNSFPWLMMPKRVADVLNKESGVKSLPPTPIIQNHAPMTTTPERRAPVQTPIKTNEPNPDETLLVMSKSGMAKMRLMSLVEQNKAPSAADKSPKPNVPPVLKAHLVSGNYEALPSDPPVATKKQPTSTFVGMSYAGSANEGIPAGRKDLPHPHDRLVKELWLEKIIGRGGITPRPGMKDEFVTAPDENHSSPGVTLKPEHSKLVSVQTAEELIKQESKPTGGSILSEVKEQHLTKNDQKELENLLKILAIENVDMDVINSKLFRKAKKMINNSTTTAAPTPQAELQIEGSGETGSTSEAPLTKSEDSATPSTAESADSEQPHMGAGAYDEGAQLLDQMKLDDNSTEVASPVLDSTTAEVLTTVSEVSIDSNATEANVSSAPSYDADSVVLPNEPESTSAVSAQSEISLSPAQDASIAVESSGEEPKEDIVPISTTPALESTTSSSETSPSPPEPTQEPKGVPEIKQPGYEPEPPSVQPEAAAEVEASGEVSENTTTKATLTQEVNTTITQEVTVTPETTVAQETLVNTKATATQEATVTQETTTVQEVTLTDKTIVAQETTVTLETTTVTPVATVAEESTVTPGTSVASEATVSETQAQEFTVTPESNVVQETTVTPESTVAQEIESTAAIQESTEATVLESNVPTTPGYGEEALAEVLVSSDEENKQTVLVAELISTEAPVTSTEVSTASPEASTQPIVEATTTSENIQTTEVIEPESESVANFSKAPDPVEPSTPVSSPSPAPETSTLQQVIELTTSQIDTTPSETTTSVTESTPGTAIVSTEASSTAAPSYSDVDEIVSSTQEQATEANTTQEASTLESIEPSGYEVAQQGDLDNIQYLTPDVEPIEAEAAVGYAGISNEEQKADQPGKKDSFANSNSVEIVEKNTESTPITSTLNANSRKWTPYMFDCTKEIDEKGALCKEWAEGGLCEINKPTMFLFCRRTCLCTGPQ